MRSSPKGLLEVVQEELAHHPGLAPGQRILVAMSGGIDSSLVAALLHRAGFEVLGVSMQLFEKDSGAPGSDAEGRCCTLDDFQDARRVAQEFGFPHFILDLEQDFQRQVMDPFAQAYLEGRTPNPCVSCNQHMKFDILLEHARKVGAAHVATGHYARIHHDAQGFHLLRGSDEHKDQSYFLFHLNQASMARALFPLGGLRKPEVRQLAAELGLHLAEKPESMEICFVPGGRYDEFLATQGQAPGRQAGPIRSLDGRLLGSHQGYWGFTVGQRRGLGISHPRPLYVLRVDPETRTVWVGEERDLEAPGLIAREPSWCAGSPEGPVACEAKLRSRSRPAASLATPLADGRLKVEFQERQRAVAPGQAVVLYRGAEVLGGAWIESALDAREGEPTL